MKPYYEDDAVTIYHGDCRNLLPYLPKVDLVLTDPVWPDAIEDITGADRPAELFAEAALLFPGIATRLVVHLGCDSDPRFLLGVPTQLPFFRVCWLEYVRPHYKGRLMYGSDVAYVFGEPPPSKEGARVIPGRFIDTSSKGKEAEHPCPRHINHVKWLLKWFWGGPAGVLDPFMGSGTTARACKDMGIPFVGIEIEEKYCEIAAKRMSQTVMDLTQ